MITIDNLTWFGHSSFLIKDSKGKRYYIDPFDLKKSTEKADIIFITHAHYDHWSPNDIRKLITTNTVVVAVNGCENLNLPDNRFVFVEPNREFTVNGLKFKTVPAYNIKPERLNYHPKESKWVGYILQIDGSKIYHAGDTDFIPEMKNLYDITIALLPIGGVYTMDVREAIQAANVIKAEITIPMHYRRILESRAIEAEREFKANVNKAVLLKQVL